MEPGQQKLKEVLAEALAKNDPAAWAAYLDEACAGNQALRAKVEALANAYRDAGGEVEATLAASALMQERPGTVIGRYKLLQEIGEGSFGAVFMAEQLEPVNRKVALKIIKAGMDTREVIARFEAERQALALMDHPNIARVLDAGATESGRPYFVMELVNGIPITDYCDRYELSMEQRLELFMKVCHAVQHAHQKGIIHRDLKPTNILVTLVDGEPVPKIIDFGVAKARGQKLTEKTLFTAFQQIIGTPTYMSPEQAELSGVDLDTRCDIYSLGVLLYELLTGTTPFEAERLRTAAFAEMVRIIRQEDPPKPSTRISTLGAQATEIAKRRQVAPELLRRELRGDLDWIVMKCLEKQRQRRYGTAETLREDLQRHLEHQPVQAGPPGAAYRARKFIRRHRVGVALTATVAGALLLGLSAAVIGFVQARQERNRARAAEHQAEQERDRAVAAEQQTEAERNHAELLAAEAALATGQAKLEAGDNWGLFDLVEAFDLAKHAPEFQRSVGRRWSFWHTYWDRLTIGGYGAGTPSPDHLLSVSVNPWAPRNTTNVVRVQDVLTGTQVVGPLVHDSIAVASAFSPDNRLLATLTRESVIHLWDLKTGAPFRPPCRTGVANLNQISFSPCGRYLVAFSGTQGLPGSSTIAFLRLDEPQSPPHFLNHRFSVFKARFSQDGELLAIYCKVDLHLWRTTDLQRVGLPLPVTLDGLVEFSPDGRKLAFNPARSGGVSLLDTKMQQIVRQMPKQNETPLETGASYTGAFSHDGRLLACFDWHGNLDVWDTASGARPYPALKLSGKVSGGLAFSPDDSWLIAGEVAGTVKVFRTSDGKLTYSLHVPGFPRPAFLTNGVLAAEAGEKVRFWDLGASPLPEDVLSHDALAHAVEFDDSGTFLAVGSAGELRLWTMQSSPMQQRAVALPGQVTALTFSSAEGQFAAFTDDGSLTLVEPRTGKTRTLGNYGLGYQFSACISPDTRKLALYHFWELQVVDTRTGASEDVGRRGTPRNVAFRRDSRRMAAGFAGWYVRMYDTSGETNPPIGDLKQFESWVECVAFHPEGKLVAAYVDSSGLYLYEAVSQRQIGTMRKTSLRASLLRFSKDGALLAVAGLTPYGKHAVELWHVDPERGLTFSGASLPCDHPVWSLAFSPDERTLVVGGLGTTRRWHLPSTPENYEAVESHTRTTLGFRMNERRELVAFYPPAKPADEIRPRLTQASARTAQALDRALKLPPAEARVAVQELADGHQGAKVYESLLARLHADLLLSAAEQGLWREALAHADDAMRLGNDNPYARYQHALLCLGACDATGYRAACQAMVKRYRSSVDPAVIKWVAWAAALAPGALDNYEEVIEQLRRAAPRVGGRQAPDYRFYLAAVLARAGRYREAAAEYEQAGLRLKTDSGEVAFSSTYYELLRAICYSHLSQDEAARKCYETGAADVRNLLRTDAEGTAATGIVPWNRRLTLRLLEEEARGLLKAPPKQPEPLQ